MTTTLSRDRSYYSNLFNSDFAAVPDAEVNAFHKAELQALLQGRNPTRPDPLHAALTALRETQRLDWVRRADHRRSEESKLAAAARREEAAVQRAAEAEAGVRHPAPRRRTAARRTR